MPFHMINQVTFGSETLKAYIAPIGFNSIVSPHMNIQISLFCELLAADAAFISLKSHVYIANMLFKVIFPWINYFQIKVTWIFRQSDCTNSNLIGRIAYSKIVDLLCHFFSILMVFANEIILLG
ncbi:UNKNOWN [Stylonychia lemnae]|uniref:Uncharacterized protein n=1 Tax=Stylonychia lemnae TaxID=5949 RepID=A0A077ZNW1_STYLE|nr:UNKNOWN [Stylonychia lemnae]|eukprot:CDW71603.1 UNKNOWN [Stylonychia lemnae]